MTYLLKVDDGAIRGAHRITISGLGDKAAWELAGKLVAQHVIDTRFRSAWSDDLPTDCVGWEIRTDGVVCYVVGSVRNWRALHAGKMSIATFDFVEQLLESRGGSLTEVAIESRELQPTSYDVRTGRSRGRGASIASRARRRRSSLQASLVPGSSRDWRPS
jgi:hypothetical protein